MIFGVPSMTHQCNNVAIFVNAQLSSISPASDFQTIYDDLMLLSAEKTNLLQPSVWQCCTPVSATAGCLRVCGGCKLKQARVTEGQVRGHVGTVTSIISSTSCEALTPAVPV